MKKFLLMLFLCIISFPYLVKALDLPEGYTYYLQYSNGPYNNGDEIYPNWNENSQLNTVYTLNGNGGTVDFWGNTLETFFPGNNNNCYETSNAIFLNRDLYPREVKFEKNNISLILSPDSNMITISPPSYSFNQLVIYDNGEKIIIDSSDTGSGSYCSGNYCYNLINNLDKIDRLQHYLEGLVRKCLV